MDVDYEGVRQWLPYAGLFMMMVVVLWYEYAHGLENAGYDGPPLMEYPNEVLIAAAAFNLAVPIVAIVWLKRRKANT